MSIASKIKKFLLDKKARKEFLELRRISKIERYKIGVTSILNYPIYYIDSASFVFTFKEIFKGEIYKFKSENKIPYIIDGGANIGLATLYLKYLHPESEITAFEPDKFVFETLSKNIKSHNLNGVTLINKGLWSKDTELSFVSKGDDAGHITNETPNNNDLSKIPVVSLNNYLDREVDFLKLDIEGAEEEVILSCRNNLRNVRRMFIEYHSYKNNKQKLNEILNILTENGFRLHINAPGLNSTSPLNQINVENDMDFQLNIFAFKEDNKNEGPTYKYL